MAALLLFEALDAAAVMADAILAWIAVLAFAVTVGLYTAALTGAWAWRAVRKAVTGPLPASQPTDAPIPPHAAERRTGPTWARTEPDHQEAA
jgi:hypothetical protein